MRAAFPESAVWKHASWDDTAFLAACANYVMEEAVKLSPSGMGPYALCTGMGGVGVA